MKIKNQFLSGQEIELTRFFEMKQKNKFLAELYAK